MKTCIFCGNKPNRKTKEHVIPRWLIAITGDPKRITQLGKSKDSLRKYPWQKFTFPACDDCNSEFANLESLAKVAVVKILNKENINSEQINTLLDWLDKVRIGLWLGHLLLDNDKDFEPNFHIKQRLGVSDRMVSIHYADHKDLGIQYSCTEFPAFRFSPSCFVLFINNVAFFNFSMEFAFSRRLGFPFPEKTLCVPNEKLIAIDNFKKGLERVMTPIVRTPTLKNSIRLYQSILNPKIGFIPEKFKTKYYDDNTVNGKSLIYVENDFTQEKEFIEDELIIGTPIEQKGPSLKNKITIQALEHQILCLDQLCPSFELLDKKERALRNKIYRMQIKVNKTHINKLKKR